MYAFVLLFGLKLFYKRRHRNYTNVGLVWIEKQNISPERKIAKVLMSG